MTARYNFYVAGQRAALYKSKRFEENAFIPGVLQQDMTVSWHVGTAGCLQSGSDSISPAPHQRIKLHAFIWI